MKDRRLILLCDKLQAIDYLLVNKPAEYVKMLGKRAGKKKWLTLSPGWLKKKRNIIIEIVENCKPEELEIFNSVVMEIYKKRNLGKKSDDLGIRTVEV